jgi:hypothetical protein
MRACHKEGQGCGRNSRRPIVGALGAGAASAAAERARAGGGEGGVRDAAHAAGGPGGLRLDAHDVCALAALLPSCTCGAFSAAAASAASTGQLCHHCAAVMLEPRMADECNSMPCPYGFGRLLRWPWALHLRSLGFCDDEC